MHISSGKLAAGLIIATAVMPFMASAQTTDVQSQIQSLLSQIQSLQMQIKTLIASSSISAQTWMASSTPSMMSPGQASKMACVTLSRNLGLGSRGDDVKAIQQELADDPESGFEGSVTGFFGPLTAKAMANFQMHNGIASSTTGFVGTLTRGFFERRCGNGEDNGNGDMMRGTISGTITANGGSSITVQNRDNKLITVNITASTSIMVVTGTSTPPTTGSTSDLLVGKMIAADGPQNSDSSIQAVHITVGVLPPPKNGGDGPRGMMPTLNGSRGDKGDDRGGVQNY